MLALLVPLAAGEAVLLQDPPGDVLLGFVAAVLGGMGSSIGALAGGIVVGLLSKLVGGYVSTAAEHGIAFALLMLALALRPQGLFGRVRLR